MSNKLFDKIIAQGYTKSKTVKQQKIVEAAIKLFAEKGYSNTSTAEIAKTAGVSEGTIFKHHGTKEQLLLSVIIPFLKKFLPAMARGEVKELLAENNITFEQFFRAVLKERVNFLSENREIFQVVVKEVIYKEELKKDLIPYFIKHIKSVVNDVVEEFKRRGQLIDSPTEQIVNVLYTLIGGFFVSRFVLLDNYTVNDEEIESIVQFVMNGIGNRTGRRQNV